MSVKNTEWVSRYTANITRIQRGIGVLEARVNMLPAPDDNGELPTLHYGHIGSVIEIAKQLDDLVDALGSVLNTR